ncbi:MAG: hypothetical protein RBU23_06360 [Candidatus Auribacterota bacterium]|nr:hypothetical protein [Candidatus Auribacterota bacterium]
MITKTKKFLSDFRVRLIVSIAILCYGMLAAYNLRIGVWQQEQQRNNNTMMFTLESAMLFRYARLSIEEGIPAHDIKIEYPYGVNPYKTFSIGGEVLVAYIYRLTQRLNRIALSLEQFHRYAIPFYFVVISMSAVFFIGFICTGRLIFAVIMALWYGVCIPSVIRSTGQEVMGENFALPVIFWHVAMFLYALKNGKTRFFIISGILLATGWMLWDMTHLYIYVLVLYMTFKRFSLKTLLALTLPLVCVSIINPYLRYHHAYSSIPMILLYLNCLSEIIWKPNNNITRHTRLIRGLILIVITVIIARLSGYGTDYSHFGDLLIAKLRFFNIKPLNPGKLSFDARVLWTPALHSATIDHAMLFFCCIFFVSLVSILIVFKTLEKKSVSAIDQYILYCFALFFILYLFFVRIHVYSVFFGILMTVMWGKLEKKQLQIIGFTILCIVCLTEYHRTLAHQRYMGRNEDYKSLGSLIQWIQDNTKPSIPVLASFTVAGPIVNYANRAVIVQPKFEKERTRRIYRDYVYAMFAQTETPLYNLATEHNAEYVIYDKGTSWSKSIYSPAYFVALDTTQEKKTLARKFEGNCNTLHKFYPVFENAKYKVFKVVTQEEIEQAQDCFQTAEQYEGLLEFDTAREWYEKAVNLYPGLWQARMRLGTILWRQGEKEAANAQWQHGKDLLSGV